MTLEKKQDIARNPALYLSVCDDQITPKTVAELVRTRFRGSGYEVFSILEFICEKY